MARRATKDTFMYEAAGPDTYVRRQVRAGSLVPDVYVEGEDTDSGALRDEDQAPGQGPAYTENRGLTVKQQLENRGLGTSDEEVAAHEQGGAAAQQLAAKRGQDKPARGDVRDANQERKAPGQTLEGDAGKANVESK